MKTVRPSMSTQWSNVKITLFVASLISLPSLSVDIVMPGLVAMRIKTGATLLQSGLIISLFMAGLGAGQMCFGPLSDRVGRRPILLVGLTMYVVAGIGCAFAKSPGELLSFRVAQGAGAGAATVLALAIIRDLLEGDAARALRSYATAAFNVVPILAPSIGAVLLSISGWRVAYAVPAALGAALLLWIALRFEETHPTHILKNDEISYSRAKLLDGKYISYVMLNSMSYAMLIAYISGSSLILMDDMGLSPTVYALTFAVTSGALMLGAWLNGYLARHGILGSYLLAAGLVFGTVSSLLLAARPVHIGATSGIFIILAVLSRGLIGPNAQQSALEPFPEIAGTAAAVLSVTQVLAGVSASIVVVPLYQAFGPQGVSYAIVVCAVAAFVAGIWAYNTSRLLETV